MVLRATQLAAPGREGCHRRTQTTVLPGFQPLRSTLSRGMQQAPGWWDAHLEWVPLHLREREYRLRSLRQRSGRWYQPGSPPLPLTQFSMQGSDLIFFFFFYLSEGVGFHFLSSGCLCLRWTQPKAHLRGDGAGGRGGHPAPSIGFA